MKATTTASSHEKTISDLSGGSLALSQGGFSSNTTGKSFEVPRATFFAVGRHDLFDWDHMGCNAHKAEY